MFGVKISNQPPEIIDSDLDQGFLNWGAQKICKEARMILSLCS